jgi:hypothetical protein
MPCSSQGAKKTTSKVREDFDAHHALIICRAFCRRLISFQYLFLFCGESDDLAFTLCVSLKPVSTFKEED